MGASQHCLIEFAGRERTNIKGVSPLADHAFETFDEGASRAVLLLNITVPIVLSGA